jgi:hypothetical protein
MERLYKANKKRIATWLLQVVVAHGRGYKGSIKLVPRDTSLVEVQCEEVSHIPREEVPQSTVQTGSGTIHPLTSYGITGLPLEASSASAVLVCIAESASYAVKLRGAADERTS